MGIKLKEAWLSLRANSHMRYDVAKKVAFQ